MSRPAASGYAALAQDGMSDDEEYDNLVVNHPGRVITTQPARISIGSDRGNSYSYSLPRHNRRHRSNSSGVDIKAINARLERWAEEIANKFKTLKKGKQGDDETTLEILYSVYVAPEGVRYMLDPPAEEEGRPGEGYITKEMFDEVVASVRRAIAKGTEPKLIKQGSSGSYFMRNSSGKIVGVFKPKDEEPYGNLNPKTMKWLHRNLFPCFFGRSCLIPNLSYISEAAACVLDRRLRSFMVPFTEVVYFASKSFHYDYWDRRAFYRRRKPLPPKVGSFQAFLTGFEDANIFLRKHPWPDQFNPNFQTPKKKRKWVASCPPRTVVDVEEEDSDMEASANEINERRFFWTEELQQNFREELEKLVILDYIMRNTDRGLDNWMIKLEWIPNPKHSGSSSETPNQTDTPSYTPPQMRASTPTHIPKLTIGAIDNSLAFPWKHPDEWRSFPFGWLFLPVSLIGQPFSQKTRDHFLPLLTSSKWWAKTQYELRALFSLDADFKEGMFRRQMAVLKGQAFNVVETLKTHDQGPLELTRRPRLHVWDDVMDVPVAVPLRVPDPETTRRRQSDLDQNGNRRFDSFSPSQDDEEEVDISILPSSAPIPFHTDLLDLSTPNSELPRTSLGAKPASDDPVAPRPAEYLSVDPFADNHGESFDDLADGLIKPPHMQSRPQGKRHLSTQSVPGHGAHMPKRVGGRRGSRAGTRRYSVGPRLGYTDDEEFEEGDLGFSAAEDQEGRTRRVIVERLETVKSRNPVFSWC
ncbi:hypothetical protein BJ508DRAFT_100478 [Ascobolus immersus RN42]|uniref:Phosphatidylinositol 4-kinase n=1 Tax=Ascobolus immersus RN42 TaxID=1160509 RepID=A0A3N4ID43_ASCIM|nr:hypothetical protein BJ508DRAFT_100478 [Ascobolus immersus RN42]